MFNCIIVRRVRDLIGYWAHDNQSCYVLKDWFSYMESFVVNSYPSLCTDVKAEIHGNSDSLIYESHCIISLLIPFEEDVCTFLTFSYSFIDQQLLLKQFCSNRLSFWDSLLTSTASAAPLDWIGCAG